MQDTTDAVSQELKDEFRRRFTNLDFSAALQ